MTEKITIYHHDLVKRRDEVQRYIDGYVNMPGPKQPMGLHFHMVEICRRCLRRKDEMTFEARDPFKLCHDCEIGNVVIEYGVDGE